MDRFFNQVDCFLRRHLFFVMYFIYIGAMGGFDDGFIRYFRILMKEWIDSQRNLLGMLSAVGAFAEHMPGKINTAAISMKGVRTIFTCHF